jgi:hypothetical protein
MAQQQNPRLVPAVTPDHVLTAIAIGAITRYQLALVFDVFPHGDSLNNAIDHLCAAGVLLVEPNDSHTLRIVSTVQSRLLDGQ